MPQRLTDMEIHEISLVDEPANEDARVVIVKAKGGFKPCDGCKDPKGCMEKGSCAMEKGYGPDSAKKPASVAKVAGAVFDAIEKMSPQIVERAMAEGFSADPDAAATAVAILKETVMDMEAVTKALEDAEARLEALEKRATDAEAAAQAKDDVIKAKEAEIAELVAKGAAKKAEKADMEDDEDDEEEVMKSLPESIRKRLQEADDLRVEMQKAKDKAELDAQIAKAKDLGVADADAVGALLLRVVKGQTTEADAKVMEDLLKAAKAVDDKSPLFKSIGSNGGAAADGDPEAILKAKADEIVAKSAGKVTFAQAYDQALIENPALYNDYIAKRRTAPAAA